MSSSVILYFGSFNPIHNGHIELAYTALRKHPQAEVWFVLSPQNPFKENRDLLSEEIRWNLLQNSVENTKNMKACDIELKLPKPSYTIQTLNVLKSQYPNTVFSILMGEDNYLKFHKWKDYTKVIEMCELIVYPRTDNNRDSQNITTTNSSLCVRNLPTNELLAKYQHRIHFIDAALLNISSTQIRENLSKGQDISSLVPWDTNIFKIDI